MYLCDDFCAAFVVALATGVTILLRDQSSTFPHALANTGQEIKGPSDPQLVLERGEVAELTRRNRFRLELRRQPEKLDLRSTMGGFLVEEIDVFIYLKFLNIFAHETSVQHWHTRVLQFAPLGES